MADIGPGDLPYRHIEYSSPVVTAALTALREDRTIRTADVDALGTTLYGALTAAALTIARAENQQDARNTMGRTMIELLEGLRPASPKRAGRRAASEAPNRRAPRR